ncbi:MAG TPA: histidinol dehydrogenase [Acidimicrobiales bacterium]|nr:histidinol dehydrogenase [Acidimicrobiales bacterium]
MAPPAESTPAGTTPPAGTPAATTPPAGLLTTIDLRGHPGDLRRALPAPVIVDDGEAAAAVRAILADVRDRGDAALRHATERFDRVRIDDIRVPPEEVKAALERIPVALRQALEAAHDNIVDYHRSQLHPDSRYERDGVVIRELRKPVDRAGLYVPGGRAPLASTVLMTAAPARVAGVGALAVCSPPGPDGRLAPAILAAAAIAGVDEVYRVGGAQAVAALAYGTESVPAVDVIVGPGNRYVAIAERLVAGEGAVGVPSAFTGPSEVAVVADATTDPTHAAVDLVVQAEHGPDGLAYLITWSEDAAARIGAEVDRITGESPRRPEVQATLEKGGYTVLVDGPEQAMAVANAVAAEHLELMTADPEALVPRLTTAGAVFLGPWAPASVGDYAAGPNHVLPTARSARFGSALRVDDFCKYIHLVDVDRRGLDRLAPAVEAMAVSEGLAAHADSVRYRTGARTPPR